MPFDLGNSKDVWGYLDSVVKSFEPRNLLMRRCQDALNIADTNYDPIKAVGPNRVAAVTYEAGRGYLQAQVQAATIRIAMPFEYKLRSPPQITPEQKVRLDLTELLLGGGVEGVIQGAADRQRHSPYYDIASFMAHRGAGAARPYWYREGRRLLPAIEVYDPFDVSYVSDEQGMVWCCIESSMTEAEAALFWSQQAALDARYQVPNWGTGTQRRIIRRIWHREGAQVYKAILGEEKGGRPQELLPLHLDPAYNRIPVDYVPVGGSAIETDPISTAGMLSTTTKPQIQTHRYGAPFHAEMLADAESINLLTRLMLATALIVGMPPLQKPVGQDGPTGEPSAAVPGMIHEVDQPVSAMVVAQASALPVLQAEIARHISLIEQKGLPFSVLGMGPPPRSELLRQGLEEAGRHALLPFTDGFKTMLRALGQGHYAGLRQEFESGLSEITLVVPAKDKRGRIQPEERTFSKEELYWDGALEVELVPVQTEDQVIRGMQAASLVKDFPQISRRFVAEKLLGVKQPELMAREAEAERFAEMTEPVRAYSRIQLEQRRLMEIEGSMRQDNRLTEEDAKHLLSLLSDDVLDAKDIWRKVLLKKTLTAEDRVVLLDILSVLREFLANQATDLKQRLIPEAQAQKGQAPGAAATVPAGMAQTQNNPAGMGNNGGGGLQDDAAAMIRAQSGSDQGGA